MGQIALLLALAVLLGLLVGWLLWGRRTNRPEVERQLHREESLNHEARQAASANEADSDTTVVIFGNTGNRTAGSRPPIQPR
ncbi:MAG: hypothetical protein ACRBK7_15650 [Acidimicrobiales bacterium]